jgi:hypothetical protein
MIVHVCYKRLFLMFHIFFRRMLQVYLSGCCICFTHMLQVFYLHVACVCNGFEVFFQVFQTHDSSVSSVFRHMLQACAYGCFKSRSSIAHVVRRECRCHVGLCGAQTLTWGRAVRRGQAQEQGAATGVQTRPSGRMSER